MRLKQFFQKGVHQPLKNLRAYPEGKRCEEIASQYDWNGYKRFYLVHIRKTGGTSVNWMFLSLSGQDPRSLYGNLAQTALGHRIISNGLIYVGWNARYINKGHYFYGFSHVPLHELDLPEKTFTITCFRDPVERVVSHYNMLMNYRENKIDHPCMATEGKWLGQSFGDFLKKIPRRDLLRQLYMFSSTFDIGEAVKNVRGLSHFFFCDEFNIGIRLLNEKAGIELTPLHVRKAPYHERIPDGKLSELRSMLEDEYIFLTHIRGSQQIE